MEIYYYSLNGADAPPVEYYEDLIKREEKDKDKVAFHTFTFESTKVLKLNMEPLLGKTGSHLEEELKSQGIPISRVGWVRLK